MPTGPVILHQNIEDQAAASTTAASFLHTFAQASIRMNIFIMYIECHFNEILSSDDACSCCQANLFVLFFFSLAQTRLRPRLSYEAQPAPTSDADGKLFPFCLPNRYIVPHSEVIYDFPFCQYSQICTCFISCPFWAAARKSAADLQALNGEDNLYSFWFFSCFPILSLVISVTSLKHLVHRSSPLPKNLVQLGGTLAIIICVEANLQATQTIP